MSSRLKPKVIAGAVAGLAVAGAGGAYAATSYLGLTEAQLHSQFQSGKSLADIAKAQGKSVDGLVQAIVDAAKKKVEAAVAAGRLTQTQADSILSGLKSHVSDFVNRTPPRD